MNDYKEKKCAGVCPCCGGDSAVLTDTELDDDAVISYYECPNCGTQYHEFYNLVYDKTEY